MSGTTQSIPASFYVGVIPGVISAGGLGVDFAELMLGTDTRTPINAILTFPSLSAVQSYYGATSKEAAAAAVYFAGYSTAIQSPGALLFAQYPIGNVGAYLRGGSVAALTLTQLQAISGVLDVTIDGTPQVSSTVNLSAATSFSSAAQLLTTGLALSGPTKATVTASMGALFTGNSSGTNLTTSAFTAGVLHVGAVITGTGISGTISIVSQTSGSTGGAGVYVTSAVTTCSAASVTAVSTTIDVTAIGSGALAVGQQVTGTGISSNTFIGAQLTGAAGGIGTYTATHAWQLPSETLTASTPVVTYDSVSGAFVVISSTTGASSTIGFGSGSIAAPLNLTQATGAVLSPGAIAAVPGTFMTAVTATNANFVTFQTLFDPDNGSGNAQKQLFAAWVNSTDDQYVYLAWDNDITPTESTTATTSLGYILGQSNSSGTVPIYEPTGTDLHLAAFVGGYAASIDYNATNGRATADYKSQAGIVPSVYSETAAANLIANNYNYYGAVANRGGQWQFYDPGSITGPYQWLDSYLDQIWLNNQCQNALMTLQTTVGRIPYNVVGYTMIRSTLTGGAGSAGPGNNVTLPPASPVAAALNNGVITPGVPLSAEEAIAVNTLAGMKVDTTITAQGWYLVIQPATAQVRAARQSPTIILIYTDGESIQRLNLSSILVQ